MALKLQRYGVYWVQLDPVRGREVTKTRPCVVVSPAAMHVTGMAVVCPLTTSLHPAWAHRLQIVCNQQSAEVMPDQIRAVSHDRIDKKIATLSPAEATDLRALLSRLYCQP